MINGILDVLAEIQYDVREDLERFSGDPRLLRLDKGLERAILIIKWVKRWFGLRKIELIAKGES